MDKDLGLSQLMDMFAHAVGFQAVEELTFKKLCGSFALWRLNDELLKTLDKDYESDKEMSAHYERFLSILNDVHELEAEVKLKAREMGNDR